VAEDSSPSRLRLREYEIGAFGRRHELLFSDPGMVNRGQADLGRSKARRMWAPVRKPALMLKSIEAHY